MAEWMPIESAPRDGTCILLAFVCAGEWDVLPGAMKEFVGLRRRGWVVATMDNDYLNGGDGMRFRDFAADPAYWMPLPEPPEVKP